MPDATLTAIDKPSDLSQSTQLTEGAPAVEQTPGGARVELDIHAPTAAQLAAPTEVQSTFLKTVPADYADKDWVKNFAKTEKPLDELFKSYENQRTAISRKTEGTIKIPDANSTPEQKAEFYKAMGVPEKPEAYEYKVPEAPKGLERYYQPDDKLAQGMKQFAHKAQLTPDQWKEMSAGFDNMMSTAVQERAANDAKLIADTQASFNKHYGDKAPQVLQALEKSASAAPEWAKPFLSDLPPAYKEAMAAWSFEFANKYISEDKLDIKNLTGQSQGQMTEKDYGDEFEKLYAKQMAFSRKPQSPEYIDATQKIAMLRAQQRSLAGKA
jgi:hypothetical protein